MAASVINEAILERLIGVQFATGMAAEDANVMLRMPGEELQPNVAIVQVAFLGIECEYPPAPRTNGEGDRCSIVARFLVAVTPELTDGRAYRIGLHSAQVLKHCRKFSRDHSDNEHRVTMNGAASTVNIAVDELPGFRLREVVIRGEGFRTSGGLVTLS